MPHSSHLAGRIGALILAAALISGAGCLSLSPPGTSGLSLVTLPDTTPIVIAPLSITMVAGPSTTPAGLEYAFTVRNTADTVAGMYGAVFCGGAFTLRETPDTTGTAVAMNYPLCPPVALVVQTLQPGQSVSFTRVLANSYIASGTARVDYYVWVQLPVPGDPHTGKSWPQASARAGRVHWGG